MNGIITLVVFFFLRFTLPGGFRFIPLKEIVFTDIFSMPMIPRSAATKLFPHRRI